MAGSSMPPTQTQTQTQEPLPLVPESIRLQRHAIAFDAGTLMRITRMAFGHPMRMTLAIVATFLAAISQIIIPLLIGDAVDHAHGLLESGNSHSEAADALFYTAMVLLAASVFRGACTMLQNYQGEAVGHAIAYEMKLAFYKKLQHQSFSYHDHVHTGDLMSRGILDIEGTRLWVHTGILRMILLAVLIVGGAAVLMSIDFFLSLVALSFVPLVGFSASFIRLKLRVLWLRLQEELGVLTRVMEENLGGIRVVRAFASQIFELARFDVISNRALAIMHRRIFIFVMGTTTMTFVFFLAMGLVLWVGGEKVLSGDITIGELAAFLAFMAILQMPVRQIAWTVNSIARASTCGARLYEILDRESEIRDRDGAQAIEVSDGVVKFENVSFSYTRLDGDLPVLHDVSFEAHRGKKLSALSAHRAVANQPSPTYCRVFTMRAPDASLSTEKTSATSPWSHCARLSVWCSKTHSFLPPTLPATSPTAIRGRIAVPFGAPPNRPSCTTTSPSCRPTTGHWWANEGYRLSGGQRQRLAIARSVLPTSQVIVFDDSTAAVDVGTEALIREELAAITAQRATIIIAHRLSSLMHADEILFLEDGSYHRARLAQ